MLRLFFVVFSASTKSMDDGNCPRCMMRRRNAPLSGTLTATRIFSISHLFCIICKSQRQFITVDTKSHRIAHRRYFTMVTSPFFGDRQSHIQKCCRNAPSPLDRTCCSLSTGSSQCDVISILPFCLFPVFVRFFVLLIFLLHYIQTNEYAK